VLAVLDVHAGRPTRGPFEFRGRDPGVFSLGGLFGGFGYWFLEEIGLDPIAQSAESNAQQTKPAGDVDAGEQAFRGIGDGLGAVSR
jgi:hypothetical protein